MKESDFYKRIKKCKNKKCQKKMMLNYTCKYPFKIYFLFQFYLLTQSFTNEIFCFHKANF